jgi:hypothetical protein
MFRFLTSSKALLFVGMVLLTLAFVIRILRNADLVGLTECRFCSHGNLSPLRDLLLTHSFAAALQAEKCVDAEAQTLPTETWVKIKLVCG